MSAGLAATVAAALGAGVTAVGTGLYLRDIRHGRTVPHACSWLVWGVIALLAAASNGACGGRWSLVVLSAQALCTGSVTVVAVRHGLGSCTPVNLFMLAVAAAGVIGWTALTDPDAATACAVLADGTGLAAILPKAWADPHSETAATYALAAVSGLLAVLAVHTWDIGQLLFPTYYFLGNTGTAMLITARRRALRPAPPTRLTVDAPTHCDVRPLVPQALC